ncbi:MAG: hypothetical protein ABW033_07940 [Acidimicrobiia bacterium]
MTTYRLRLESPFRADARAETANALDALGGDIISVDLREVDGHRAIDEVVVMFPDDPGSPTLSRALEHEPATLLSSQRCEPHEPITRARAWAADSDDDTDLVEKLSSACPLSTVSIRPATEARALPVVQMALDRGGPVALRCAPTAAHPAPSDRSSAWLLAVPDRYPDADAVALLVRPVSLRFTAGEAARVGVLMAGTR